MQASAVQGQLKLSLLVTVVNISNRMEILSEILTRYQEDKCSVLQRVTSANHEQLELPLLVTIANISNIIEILCEILNRYKENEFYFKSLALAYFPNSVPQ